MEKLYQLGVVDIADKVRSGELGAVEVTQAFLNRASELNPKLDAFLTLDGERALAQAAQVDRKRKQGSDPGKLAGVPIALKDNICTRGIRTTCASKILEHYVPPYDAHVVERLRDAGAVVLGKTNLDEFAMGSSNENSAYATVKNPWELGHVPGGSSGGSAAATAASLCAVSLGSDTGGSVRQPGSFCGVMAVKPTYGRVSRFGLIAFASSLDQIGPMARSSKDAARTLAAIAGYDDRDATSVERPVDDYEAACGKPIKGLRIGVVKESFADGSDPEVVSALKEAIKQLQAQGASVEELELPHAKHAVSVYYLVATAEASSNLARFDGMRYGLRVDGEDLRDTYNKSRGQGFGPEVKRRIMLGTYALSAGYYDAFYLKATKVRTLIRNDYTEAFKNCDVVLSPTAPTPAFAFGARTGDPLAMYLEDIFTLPASLAGVPAVNVPCGFSKNGLPIGMQLCAPAFEEGLLFKVASAYEQLSDWHLKRPSEFA
ncbi:MAG: Asp-tRNA(Asn)/Glu-tRNA(Gln) amidotransferase subunit GatA [Myxococcales bacterium]|nr:MAG: Asp-tRNA(Asn)/Glu-tRNA(Gln) amidotransferase subunit GatA [Myxococcales bacterium]